MIRTISESVRLVETRQNAFLCDTFESPKRLGTKLGFSLAMSFDLLYAAGRLRPAE